MKKFYEILLRQNNITRHVIDGNYYYSIIEVIGMIIKTDDPEKYWNILRVRYKYYATAYYASKNITISGKTIQLMPVDMVIEIVMHLAKHRKKDIKKSYKLSPYDIRMLTGLMKRMLKSKD